MNDYPNPINELPEHLQPYFQDFLDRLEAAWANRDGTEILTWINNIAFRNLELNAEALLLADTAMEYLWALTFNESYHKRNEPENYNDEHFNFLGKIRDHMSALSRLFHEFKEQVETPKSIYYVISSEEDRYHHNTIGHFSTEEKALQCIELYKEYDILQGRDNREYELEYWLEGSTLNYSLYSMKTMVERERKNKESGNV